MKILLPVIGCVVIGACTYTRSALTGPEKSRLSAEVRKQASFELGCADVQIVDLDPGFAMEGMAPFTQQRFGVAGCDRRASYWVRCYGPDGKTCQATQSSQVIPTHGSADGGA